jgi:hypothetical protein
VDAKQATKAAATRPQTAIQKSSSVSKPPARPATAKPAKTSVSKQSATADGLPDMQLDGDLLDDPIGQALLGRSKNTDFNGAMTDANIKKFKVP